VHPGGDEAFEWDEDNERELARHHITPYEVEQVLDNEPTWARNKRGRAGDWIMVGRTNGGRILTIVVKLNAAADTVRPVTGWGSTQGEQTRYLRR
jgi:uncharacterized DUF497 family protein